MTEDLPYTLKEVNTYIRFSVKGIVTDTETVIIFSIYKRIA